MLMLHRAIHSGSYPNASTLALELEVSTKSIHRDLVFMRDRLQLPLEYHPQKNGYFYTQPVSSFPTLHISEGELFALLVAEKALQQYRGTNFEKPLLSALKKMSASLPDSISLNLADWDKTISFRTRAEPILNLQVFDVLAKATVRRQQLTITYRKPGRREAEQRTVDPYHLANINGEWFLFAFDHLRKDVRTFVPARILEVRPTGRTFEASQKFSVENQLRDSFGVRSGQKEQEVVVRFSHSVADFIREKKWHGSQRLRELKNGDVELSLTLSGLVEVQRWVLSWGGNAVVIRPPELVKSVKEAAQTILAKLRS
jgi:predicted DNA-binding transcriptional regulator YafY